MYKRQELLSVGSTRPEWSVDGIKALIEQTVLALVPLAQAAQVSLKWYAPDGCRLRVDRELWRSLLSNLIENAVKASKPGSSVLVGARAEDGGVLLVVQDVYKRQVWPVPPCRWSPSCCLHAAFYKSRPPAFCGKTGKPKRYTKTKRGFP